VKVGKVGTTRRSDGRLQATYASHPLYFYEADNQPGEVLCQAVNEFGGYWYVLRASGKAVR
jgi:predicted lipoprotein with Yx(FWY)xxD motif